jgi:hypothetical protein
MNGRDQAIAKLNELGVRIIEAEGLVPYTMDTIMDAWSLDVEPFEHSVGPCGAALVNLAGHEVPDDAPFARWFTFVCTNPRAHKLRSEL